MSSNTPMSKPHAVQQEGTNHPHHASLLFHTVSMPQSTSTLTASWEYLMPKRKERAAGYIRESDPSLADSNTIDSQAKAVREHCQKEGYDYDSDHEYKEALSAYMIPYTQRPKLMELLAAAKRGEFDVLVVSEIRAISRKQVEVFVLYDLLQKYGVRLETIQEKFEDSAMGRLILSLRAFVAEVERENIYMRLQRGKRDRLQNGAPNGHPFPSYGFVFIDTERETNAKYEFDHTVVHIDSEGTAWTPVMVRRHIFSLAKQRESFKSIAEELNVIGLPPPKKAYKHKNDAHWQATTVHRMLTDPMAIGEVWANKYRRENGKVYMRPREEWVLLPEGTAPPLIDRETYYFIQQQLADNKQDSLRNNKHDKDLGILRAGYVFCGICGRRMHVIHHNPHKSGRPRYPEYLCRQKEDTRTLMHCHTTSITLSIIDQIAWERVVEVLKNPAMVRAKVAELRAQNKPVIDTESVNDTIENIKQQMQNLFALAQHATDDFSIESLGRMMKDLEKQKRDAVAMLYDIEEDAEEREAVEAEIVKFEKWVAQVQPLLTDPTYTPSYEEQRLAVRILGVRTTVFPQKGDYPFRHQVDITVPAILSKMHCVTNNPW